MTRKFLTIFLAVSVALSLSACQNKNSSNSSTAEVTTTVSETTETVAESEASVEKFEWGTIDDLSDELYLDGVQVKVPGTLEDLGEDYSISNDRKDWFEDNIVGNKELTTALSYKDKVIGTISFHNFDGNYDQITDETPFDMIFLNLNCYDKDVKFCGMSEPFTKTKIKQVLDEPGYIASNGGLRYFNVGTKPYPESIDDMVAFGCSVKDKDAVYCIYILNCNK